MRYVPPQRWSVVLAAGAVAAIAIALMTEPLANALGAFGSWPKFAVILTVNVLLPLSIILISLAYPRMSFTPVACILVLVTYTFGRALVHEPRVWLWTPGFLLNVLHPIVVAACAVGTALAAIAVSSLHPFRRVGVPYDPDRCRKCGYLCIALTESRCPECGAPFSRDVGASLPNSTGDRNS